MKTFRGYFRQFPKRLLLRTRHGIFSHQIPSSKLILNFGTPQIVKVDGFMTLSLGFLAQTSEKLLLVFTRYVLERIFLYDFSLAANLLASIHGSQSAYGIIPRALSLFLLVKLTVREPIVVF